MTLCSSGCPLNELKIIGKQSMRKELKKYCQLLPLLKYLNVICSKNKQNRNLCLSVESKPKVILEMRSIEIDLNRKQ
jgi:hypothetical protein